jgi:hypothetical protein
MIRNSKKIKLQAENQTKHGRRFRGIRLNSGIEEIIYHDDEKDDRFIFHNKSIQKVCVFPFQMRFADR